MDPDLPVDAAAAAERQLGSAAIGVFLLLWLGYAAAWPAHAIGTLTKQALVGFFPGVALDLDPLGRSSRTRHSAFPAN